MSQSLRRGVQGTSPSKLPRELGAHLFMGFELPLNVSSRTAPSAPSSLHSACGTCQARRKRMGSRERRCSQTQAQQTQVQQTQALIHGRCVTHGSKEGQMTLVKPDRLSVHRFLRRPRLRFGTRPKPDRLSVHRFRLKIWVRHRRFLRRPRLRFGTRPKPDCLSAHRFRHKI